MDFGKELFKGKTFSGLLEDIYMNRNDKEERIKILINELRPLIKTTNDAVTLVPLLKEYMDVAVKNDEHLVKMAGIVQRAIARSIAKGEEDILMSDDELEELLEEYQKSDNGEDKKLKETQDKLEDFLEDHDSD